MRLTVNGKEIIIFPGYVSNIANSRDPNNKYITVILKLNVNRSLTIYEKQEVAEYLIDKLREAD